MITAIKVPFQPPTKTSSKRINLTICMLMKTERTMRLIHSWVLIAGSMTLLLQCLSTTCDQSYECAGSSISQSAAIECRGANSCREMVLLESSGSYVRCEGAFSCYKSDLINTTINNVYCDGLFSCANSQAILALNIQCRGEKSCQNVGYIEMPGSLQCRGSHSCENTNVTMTSSNTIDAHGAFALANSFVRGQGSGLTLQIYGAYGAANSTLVCGDSCSCTIKCYGANSCQNLTTVCDSCALIHVQCFTEKSGLCPDEYDMNSYSSYALPEYIKDLEISTYANSYNVCYATNTSSINCDDFQDSKCYGATSSILNTQSDPAPICCIGHESCVTSGNLTSYFNGTNAVTGMLLVVCLFFICLQLVVINLLTPSALKILKAVKLHQTEVV